MSEIIRGWLQQRIGLLFGEQTWDEDKGGGILATLLTSYTILTHDQLNIILSKGGDLYEPTLEVMRLLINDLGIPLSKEEYRDVLNARGSAITKLFYELFIVLQGRGIANIFLERKRTTEKHPRFTVKTYNEETDICEDIDVEKFSNPLAESLSNKDEVVKYHINKYLELMKTCKKSRDDYITFLESSKKVIKKNMIAPSVPCEPHSEFNISELPADAESLNQSMTELIKETKNAQRLHSIVPDKAVSMKIISSIQGRKQKANLNRDRRETCRKQILKNLWDELMEEQENYFKHQFTDKLQQQSLYEQKMTTSLLHIKDKQHDIADQKKLVMEQVVQQRETDIFNAMFEQSEETDRERYKHYKELDKKMILHRRLYQKKEAHSEGKVTEECERIVKDILDIAFYNIDYKEVHCDEVGRRKRDDLARLFVAKQPIMDFLSDVTDVIQPEEFSSSENMTKDFDEAETITLLELDRQNALDDLIFEDYHNFKWPWDYNSWMEFPEYTEMVLGLNVLGHVVHRLLGGKYPRKPACSPTPVRRTDVAVCVDGFHRLEYLPVLKELLHGRNILVAEVKDAFEYCLGVFKKDTTTEYLDQTFADVPQAPSEEPSAKLPKKGAKKMPLAKEQKKELNDDVLEPSVPFEEKSIQTPNVFPEEEMVLTSVGVVGKDLFETMNKGDLPNEQQSAAAFVEYLNSFHPSEMEGWVLINYPQTIQQAVALEEALSGVQIPKVVLGIPTDTMENIVQLSPGPGPENGGPSLKGTRRSVLLSNPKGVGADEVEFDTFLTGFIQMRTKEEAVDADELISDAFRCPENTEALDRLYQSQGCKYRLLYDEIGFVTIKQLGKLILGDYSLPLKDSETLFTDTVHYVETNFQSFIEETLPTVLKEGVKKERKEVKKPKDKGSKVEESEESVKSGKGRKAAKGADKSDKAAKAGKAGKKDKKPKAGSAKDKPGKGKKEKAKAESLQVEEQPRVDMEDEETQIPTPVPELEESEQDLLQTAVAGDYQWVYHDLPLMPYYESALATLWENLEDIYINDMKQLFFRRRVIMDALMPYNTFVKNNLQEFIARPDEKQKYLTEFQLLYNEFEDDMREDEEVKAELHLRIEEFREKLWKICDARKNENEEERVRIIQEKWVTTQLMELCNIYTTFIQLEIDRSTDSSQLLLDYYWAMMTGTPCKNTVMEKAQLELIPLPRTIEDMDHIAPFLEFAENILQHGNRSKNDKDPEGGDGQEGKATNNPFVNKLQVCLKVARDKIDNNLKVCEKSQKDLEVNFHPLEAKVKVKAKKEKMSVPGSEINLEEPESDAKQNSTELLQELQVAYTGEYLRCDLRLKILEHTFEEEVQDMLDKGSSSFLGMYKSIEQHYRGEVRAVDQATRMLNRAVEEETAIQPEMILQDDMFYIKLGSLMYESPLPDDDDEEFPTIDPLDDEVFTISQLERIVDVLYKLAPTGVIPERAFAFLLQDFIVYKGEDGQEDYIPKVWKSLPPHKVQGFMRSVFGESEYLDWKDFIIYGLLVRFPTEAEVLRTRAQFRELDPDMTEMIQEHQYPQIQFWFENEVSASRLRGIRQLLFRLYSVKSELNYTALLLSFCKDTDPILGLVKALEVSLGKVVMYDQHLGLTMYMKDLKEIMAKELDSITKNRERVDIENMSRDIVEKMIDDTVHQADSVALMEIDEQLKPPCSNDILQYLNEPHCTSLGTSTDSGTTSENEYHGDSFTNSGSQGYDTQDAMVYQVGFDIIMNVITVTLPWLHRTKSFGEITFHERFALLYNSLINDDIRTAFVYQIFMDADFVRIIQSFYRFYDRRLVDIVRELLDSE